MKGKRGVIISIFLLIMIIPLSFYFDKQISVFFSSLRNIYLSQLFLAIKFFDTEIFVVIYATLLLISTKKKRKWIIPAWLTMGITAITTFLLKVIAHRTRPFAAGIVSLLPGVTSNADYLVWNFSFPSFDAAFAFCLIPLISKFYPKFKYVWISFAGLVLLSRVYFGVHYLSDAISGALIGLLIGIIILKFENKKKVFRKVYNKMFKKKK